LQVQRPEGLAAFAITTTRWLDGRELPTRRVFQGKAGNQIGQLEIPPRSYDARQRSWYVDARKADQLVTPSPIFGSI
jgi:adenylate cyclase